MADPVPVLLLNRGERIAVMFTGALGTLSTLSVTLLLLHIFVVATIPLLWRSTTHEYNREERVFLRMHLGVFVVCLLCSDLVQGISGTFQLKWATEGRVSEGNLCTAQAAMLLFGDNGTAIWTSVISFHTVLTIVGGKRLSSGAVIALVLGGWIVTGFLTLIGPIAIEKEERGAFFGIAGAWCFITSEYGKERIYVHYVPMLLSAGLITVNYVLVALVLSGVLVHQNRTWRFVAPYRRRQDSHRWNWPPLSFSRLQRSTSSAPNKTQGSDIRIVGLQSNISKEADGGVGKAPGRPGTSDSNFSNTSKSSPQALEFTITSNPKDGPTTRPGRLQRRPTVPSSQVHFKNLALKMLWYPIVYIALVLPIACSRISTKHKFPLRVMLPFMCLLWLMGTANVIVYVTTRRIGRSPVLRSRSQSRGRPSQDENRAPRSVQVFVDQHTQVEHVIPSGRRPNSPADSLASQRPHFDFNTSDLSPALPTGVLDSDLEAQRRWRREPSENEGGVIRIIGTAL